MAPSDPAARHRRIAATFGARVDGVAGAAGGALGGGAGPDAWDGPTPVPEWTVRDVVGHLVTWFPGFLAAGAGIELPAGPAVADDPAGAWRAHADAVQAVLDDPATADRTFELVPHIAATPLAEAIDRFYTTDVLMHGWDLARATGQADRFDPDEAEELLAGMEPVEAMLRASGQYGPRVEVADDADPTDRLVAFIGRDPAWTRPPV